MRTTTRVFWAFFAGSVLLCSTLSVRAQDTTAEPQVEEWIVARLAGLDGLDLDKEKDARAAGIILLGVALDAGLLEKTVEAEMVINQVAKHLSEVPEKSRGYFALAKAAMAEACALRLDRPTQARETFLQAQMELAELKARGGLDEEEALTTEYHQVILGAHLFKHLADSSNVPEDVHRDLANCRNLESRRIELENLLVARGLNREELSQRAPQLGSLADPQWQDLGEGQGETAMDVEDLWWDRQREWSISWVETQAVADSLDLAVVWSGNRFKGFEEAKDRWAATPFPWLVVNTEESDVEWEILVPLPPSGHDRNRMLETLHCELGHRFVRLRSCNAQEIATRRQLVRHAPQLKDLPEESVPPLEGVAVKPRLVKLVPAAYPELARAAGIQGQVLVKVLIGTEGQVLVAEVLQPVNPLLDKAAVEAAYQAIFEPARQRDTPVKAWMAIPFSFRLEE